MGIIFPTKKLVKWHPHRLADGEILQSRCGRFCIVQGSSHFTLLYNGTAVERGPREDLLKITAETIAVKDGV